MINVAFRLHKENQDIYNSINDFQNYFDKLFVEVKNKQLVETRETALGGSANLYRNNSMQGKMKREDEMQRNRMDRRMQQQARPGSVEQLVQ